MNVRRVLGGVGRVMIATGVLILLFVAYQLWGTGLRTAQAQNDLEAQFEEQAEAYAAENPEPAEPDPAEPADPPTDTVIPPPPTTSEIVGRIEIPSIGENWMFLQGVGLDVLKDGPGHYEGTPLPGEEGNAAIAGHRTTYGQPFHNIDQLGPGDRIIVTYITGARFEYEYRETEIVSPDRVDVIENTEDDRLTLTACHPKYSAAERIVVRAALVGQPLPPQPVQDTGEPVVLQAESLDGEAADRLPAFLWGFAAAAVFGLAWAVGHWWRKLPAYLIGTPVFLVVLFVFFENFSRLLPAAY
ncbi:MAG: class E sortase [Actinomycetota bacterium]